MIRFSLLTIIFTLLFINCKNNDSEGKDMGVNGKKEQGMIEEVAPDNFRSTSLHYPEYNTLEKNEKGYDACELLSMHSITSTCKPTSAVNIFNQNKGMEKSCVYSWMGENGRVCQVKLSIQAYSLKESELRTIFKTDKDGVFDSGDSGVRWVSSNKVFSVSYIGEVYKKVNILTIKNHVKPLK